MVDSFIYFHLDGWCTADALFIYIYTVGNAICIPTSCYISTLYAFHEKLCTTINETLRFFFVFFNDSSPFLFCCQKNSTRLKCFRCIIFSFWVDSFHFRLVWDPIDIYIQSRNDLFIFTAPGSGFTCSVCIV